jgi:hypothetical protein
MDPRREGNVETVENDEGEESLFEEELTAWPHFWDKVTHNKEDDAH